MGRKTLKPDICVIGAGSGGLTVSAAASAFGVDVVLIEKDKMGGDCLNTGCVPSKALIAAAKRARDVRAADEFGLAGKLGEVDFQAVHDHVHGVIAAIAPHDSVDRFTELGVQVIKGEAHFIDARTVVVGDTEIRARRFVVATGSSAAVPPIPGLKDVAYDTNETIFERTELPEHLIVIGGGPIGLELAQAHRRLGARVTVVEALTILSKDDRELVQVVRSQAIAEDIDLIENAKVTSVAKSGPDDQGVALTLDTGGGTRSITGSHLLVATGRRPNVAALGLDAAGIDFEPSGIVIDKGLRTTNRRVYAIGDAAGGLQFTHWAGYQAGLVIRSALFRMPVKENRDAAVWVTFTDPELAHVGLTETQARARHGTIRVLKFLLRENDRARAELKTNGLIKVTTTARGRILGADIVGAGAGEQIAIWALAISRRLKISAMAGVILPYPTLTESAKRVAVEYFRPSLNNRWLRRIIIFLQGFG
jgi:pyruvate/2-oxoglutarate dehydrogenase complex dihydrolipoamide dehydrogenase (E3) component